MYKRNNVRLTDAEWSHITTKLHKGSVDERQLAAKIEKSRDITDAQAAYIDAALADYSEDGRVEIDLDAIISEGESGAYVQAWVWVDQDRAGVYAIGDTVLASPEDGHEFTARVVAVELFEGGLLYTVVDQEDNGFRLRGNELKKCDEN